MHEIIDLMDNFTKNLKMNKKLVLNKKLYNILGLSHSYQKSYFSNFLMNEHIYFDNINYNWKSTKLLI